MPDLTQTTLGQNYRKTAPSSRFGTREMAFYGVYVLPYKQDTSTPFEITFFDQTYGSLYVGTNGYLTFGDGTDNYEFGDDPTMGGAELPAIVVSSGDNSYQYVYSKTWGNAYNNTRRYTVRYEGSSDTSATSKGPNMIWEVTFYEERPGIVDLLVVADAKNRGGDGVSGVTDGTNWQDNYFEGHIAGWGPGAYRIDTSDGTNALVTTLDPTKLVEQGPVGMQIEHQFNHDTGGSTNDHDEDDDYVQVFGGVWNGSDYAEAVRAIQQVAEVYYVGQPIVGMGMEFVIAVADDTALHEMIGQALFNVWGPAFAIIPMTVGPESIYVAP